MSAYLVVVRQAEDAGLWFPARYATEAYLQSALRELHAAVEHERDLLRDACDCLREHERFGRIDGRWRESLWYMEACAVLGRRTSE